jgi:hypothetical protein
LHGCICRYYVRAFLNLLQAFQRHELKALESQF